MKNTAKVFIWIGIIAQCFLIYPIVVGVIALQKLNEIRKKEEIQTIGILTLFFCSLVGGIIMLTMTDKDLSENRTVNTVNISLKQDTHSLSYELLCKVLSLSILGIVLLSFVFSMIPLINFGDAFVPFVLTSVLIVVSVILIIAAFKKNKKIFVFITLVIIGLSVAVIILSILHCCGLALVNGNPFEMPDLDILIGCIVCSGICIVMAGVLFFTAIKNKNEKFVNAKDNVYDISNYGIEAELEEVKSLFEKGLFDERDYNLAKQTIIKKYYN